MNLCLECPVRGKCCYHKVIINNVLYILLKCPCSFLDTETGLCKVYEHRFEENPNCLSVERSLELNSLPQRCLYLKDGHSARETIYIEE
jgi:uncharacterized cysteine cluster protein YcgN (CxxCxxCC family)